MKASWVADPAEILKLELVADESPEAVAESV